ncbi:hypothetical protein [Microbacterium sp. SS28]|uniref:hypothetical protein n=1 Tax=Microbacterium sp. SS28 TaxID=2919948 RepID=UPI001FAA6AA3|nr:hypothetical protein [Microbacterium sp. SS28]
MEQKQGTTAYQPLAGIGWLAIWTIAWLATLALAQFAPEALWDAQPVLSWIAIALNVAVGIVWIASYARFLRGADDLQRKIQMDAMAAALGAGLVGGCAYAAASSAGLVSFDSDIAFLIALMAVAYLIAILVGSLRYR